MPPSIAAFLVAATALAGASGARATGACVDATGGIVVPDGREAAPRNATPFVDAEAPSRLVRDDDVEVEVDVDTIAVIGGTFGDGQVFRLRPRELLEAGRSYSLVEGVERAFVQSTFSVADVIDDEAPVALRAQFNPGSFDGCGATSIRLNVSEGSVAEEEARVGAALFGAAFAPPTLDEGATWNGASASMHNSLAVHGVNDGDALHVVGIDMAGNIGPAVEVTLEPAPAVGGGGCSAGTVPPVVVLGLLAVRARRAGRCRSR